MPLKRSGKKATAKGFADGTFKRPMSNPYPPYTDNWHAYNAAYLDGHSRNVDTSNLTSTKGE